MHPSIDPAIYERILHSLATIEEERNVRILYACESGSRAWGFASIDSDYDVRFVYIHRPEHYTSIDLDARRDVIEKPIDDELDISGWDIRKGLKLFRKSNPPLLEWLSSPIVYKDEFEFSSKLVSLEQQYFSKKASTYHYLSIAKRNTKANLSHDLIKHKKYFYALRPLLGVQWLERFDGPVPMRFQTMVEKLALPPEVRAAIDDLLTRKASTSESAVAPPIKELSHYIESELDRLADVAEQMPGVYNSADKLDELFRNTLHAAWGYT